MIVAQPPLTRLETGQNRYSQPEYYKKVGLIIKHIGEKYGSYTIIEKTNQKANDGHSIYIGKCECGATKSSTLSNFKFQSAKQCPHFRYYGEIAIPSVIFNSKRLAHIFYGMLRRCYDTENKDYKYYGARGISVCQEWRENPNLFEEWAMNNGYEPNLTIDRICENNNYEPENCRWTTLSNNSRFKSNTNYITAKVTLSGKQWAELIPDVGINYINQMLRNKGEEETIKYIEQKLKDKRIS